MNKLFQLQKELKDKGNAIKSEKKSLHKQFVQQNRNWFRALDILIVCVVLFNFGAVVLTQIMVFENNPDAQIVELNPVMAELHGLPEPEDREMARDMIASIGKQFIIWFVLIGCYVHFRARVFTDELLLLVTVMVCYYFVIMGWDFFNDLGLWIGRLIYGGG